MGIKANDCDLVLHNVVDTVLILFIYLFVVWGNEDVKLSGPETKKWRMQFMNKKWLCINEELEYKKIVNCTNKAHMIHLGEYLDKVKHKWESRVRKE
jgi:hypothetical protein